MEAVKEEVNTRVTYRERLEKALATQKEMKSLLEFRMELNNKKIKEFEDKITKPTIAESYEMNEARISNIKTQGELDVLKKVIYEKQNYYDKFCEQHEKDWEEVQKRWPVTLTLAKKSQTPAVKKLMETIQWDMVEIDEEIKIAAYKALKRYI